MIDRNEFLLKCQCHTKEHTLYVDYEEKDYWVIFPSMSITSFRNRFYSAWLMLTQGKHWNASDTVASSKQMALLAEWIQQRLAQERASITTPPEELE